MGIVHPAGRFFIQFATGVSHVTIWISAVVAMAYSSVCMCMEGDGRR